MPCLLVFLFFCSISPGILRADQPIEIYVKGARYGSVDAYKAAKDQPKPAPVPHTIIVRQEPALTPQTRQVWDNISLEHGIGRVMADFDQSWDNPTPKFSISTEELADRLQALAGDRKGPVLVVADPHKLRVAVQEDNP